MSFFRVIIPNYNNAQWLRQSIKSVIGQTFEDWQLMIVDDKSDDDSWKVIDTTIQGDDRCEVIFLQDKHYNGGSRNIGLNYFKDSKYTLFLDSDDWFASPYLFQELHDLIEKAGEPDCVRLSYNCIIGENTYPIILEQDTPEKLVNALEVACWTKCIKTELIQLFPENTLMEDVVQHIRQCDKIESVVLYRKPAVNWNRNNANSCSREENQNLQQGKWQSSMYRYAADLMDTHCEKDYCEKHRQWRLEVCLNNIKEGKYIQ